MSISSRRLKVGSLMKRDIKNFDVGLSQNLVSTASPFLLFYPIEGSEDGERIGRKTTIISFQCRLLLQSPKLTGNYGNGNDESVVARLIFYVDKQPNHATHTSTALLVSATSLSHFEVNNRNRFRIISDRSYLFGSDSVVNNNLATDYGFFEKKGKNSYTINSIQNVKITTVFNSSNLGTIADIESGAFYVLCLSSSSTTGGCNGNIRMKYTDC